MTGGIVHYLLVGFLFIQAIQVSLAGKHKAVCYFVRSITLCRILTVAKTTSSADAGKPARRVSRSVKVTKHCTIRYVSYGFLLVFYSNFVPKPHRFLIFVL